MEDAIGAIDWPKVIEAAAASPLGMVALVIILISFIGYFMLKGTSQHYRFIAFIMLFGGGVSLSMSVIDEKDFNRRPVNETQAKVTKHIPIVLAQNLKTSPAFVKAAKPVASTKSSSTAIKNLNTKNTILKVKRIKYRNAACSASKIMSWPIVARSGWNIVPGSVKVKTALRSRKT